jgi:hypothetical protein
LEVPVLTALLDLASNPELLDAWRHARRFAPEQIREDADGQLRPTLKRRLRALRRQRERLHRHFVDRLAAGAHVDERDFADLIAAVRAEEDQLRMRLNAAELSYTAPLSTPTREPPGLEGLKRALVSVLTISCPDDTPTRIRRAALVQALLPGLVVRDAHDGVALVLSSPFAPRNEEQA